MVNQMHRLPFGPTLASGRGAHCEPLRHPIPPGLSLTSCQLITHGDRRWASRVASGLLCLHAIAIIPAGPMEPVRSSISIVGGLPCEKVRSAPAIVFSG